MAVDLSLLPHLSDRALREEAEQRGVVVNGLDRAALIEAIRAHEARAATRPPPPEDASRSAARTIHIAEAPTEPPPRGPLHAARALLGRVLGLARSAAEPRRETPSAPPPSDEPIRTRSMARLLEQQGHLTRALPMVRELRAARPDDEELARWEERLTQTVAERALAEHARSETQAGSFVRFVLVEGRRGVVWHVDEPGVDRARALLGGDGALLLRVVRVLSLPDHSVETRQADRPTEHRGWALLDAPLEARLVVAIGVGDGERFASIAHASA